MKHLLRTILLLGILCMAGCKEDQFVSFADETLEAPSYGWTYSLSIEANCPWTITSSVPGIRLESSSGDGSSTVVLHLYENNTYDDKTIHFTITSEDGTSSDVLTILQKATVGLEAGNTGMISEEGGTFEVPIRTNDDITSIDTPDWMTFTSSRALTGYTYTFTAEPNKTGSVRKGTVSFKGKSETWEVEVAQDSYAPTGVDLSAIPDMIPIVFSFDSMSSEPVSYPLVVTPEYADLSKLSIVSPYPSICNAEISDGAVTFSFPGTSGGYGQYMTFTFLSDGKEIARKKVEPISGKVSISSGRREFYLGEEFRIDVITPEKYYTTESSDNSAISVLGPNEFRANKTGTYTIRFINKASFLSTDLTYSRP